MLLAVDEKRLAQTRDGISEAEVEAAQAREGLVTAQEKHQEVMKQYKVLQDQGVRFPFPSFTFYSACKDGFG